MCVCVYVCVCCAVRSRSVMSDSVTPWTVAPPGSSDHGDSPGKEYWSGLPCPPPGDLPNPGFKPRSPTLQADSFPQRKTRNTRVHSLSLLQWIFLTQELNWGLLHCRQILYQLSYQRSAFTYTHTYTLPLYNTDWKLVGPQLCGFAWHLHAIPYLYI